MSELKLPQEILTCRVSAIDLANMLMIQEATGLPITLYLHADQGGDRRILGGGQGGRVDLPGPVGTPRLGDRGRTQQAAHMVGPEGRLEIGHVYPRSLSLPGFRPLPPPGATSIAS